MGLGIVRFRGEKSVISWGCLRNGQLFELPAKVDSLAALLESDVPEQLRQALRGPGRPAAGVELLSPVTAPCQIICQGKNYLDHLVETGVRPENKDFNLLFAKACSSLASPSGLLRRPEGVRLLDYEIELGLVIGRPIDAPVAVSGTELGNYVAGLVLANDVSARDVQIPERQWFRGKSFRGFCPVGPVFYWMEPEDWAALYELRLELKVNGQLRQKASLSQMLHRPPETLELISRCLDLRPGDLLLTGTPGGVAMRVPPKKLWEEIVGVFAGEKRKFARFIEEQERSGRYLRAGDRIEARIWAEGRGIDLGTQELLVQ